MMDEYIEARNKSRKEDLLAKNEVIPKKGSE